MEEIVGNPTLGLVLDTLIYIACGFVLFLVGKFAFDWSHRPISVRDELVKKDNLAFALTNIGYYIGLLLGIGSVILGPTYGILMDVIDILAYGLLAIVLLNLSALVNDRLILRNFSIRKEIVTDQNAGTGAIQAAVYIASGLIIFGALYGEGVNFFPDMAGGFLISGFITAIVFWMVGQVGLLITGIVYNAILPHNVHEYIERDNVAAGIGFAGALIAIAILISHGTSGDFYSWEEHFSKVGLEVIIGLVLLPVIRFLTDKILLPGEKITDEIFNQEKPNLGASMVEAFAYAGGAVLITWCL